MSIRNTTGSGITQAQAQAACSAAITAANLPDSADVETACDASIASAALATATDLATLQTSVDGLPDATSIETACTAALDTKFPRIPNTNFGPYGGTPLTGSLTYVLIAATPDYYGAVYGVIVTADQPCSIGFISSGGAALGGVHNLIAGVPFSPSAMLPVQSLYRSNLEEGITITCSSTLATLVVTYWGALVYAF